MEENRRLVFIIKTNFDCNMKCAYCYEGDRLNGVKMSQATLNTLVNNIGDYSVETGNSVEFIWHGGEPLLAGLNFYNNFVKRLKSIGPNFNLINSIQTNGILMDDYYADFFVENKFVVGISIDGPPLIHDSQRFGIDGKKGTFKEVYSALIKMDDRGHRPGALAVFTRNTYNHLDEFYKFFRDRSLSVKLNPIIFDGRAKDKSFAELQVTPQEYGDALIELFDRWIQEPEYTFSIDPLNKIIRSIVSGNTYACSKSGRCYDYFKIFPLGDIHLCGKQPYHNHSLGNIKVKNLSDVIDSIEREEYKQIRNSIKNICGNCEHIDICNGGCSNSAYTRFGNSLTKDYWCGSNKKIFSHIKNVLAKIQIIDYKKI